MPLKLSENPIRYDPPTDRAELKQDLETFSDPDQYVQDDPMLRDLKILIVNELDAVES